MEATRARREWRITREFFKISSGNPDGGTILAGRAGQTSADQCSPTLPHSKRNEKQPKNEESRQAQKENQAKVGILEGAC